ncbi:BZ3500_MvSof-1268-A1-R1_Chr4-2g06895 [Microbotryum saponariae]|uniref:BZ3500_MvSof-1268-A1-R1_Chr4-2g06895 protein n=1 Tax=Microbotryum saponariae TaxID=289078 RepID=A0A2X0MRI9_9BASI|nr:BZ3500_MvSof-1268-A1-R1_Chr4-2g06895 [Microbotryum saponariae]SDA06560.1 BZ3501_MvSof-1269-A2-R1_Chr4-2g06606 [Microbotryum saponariae]
MGRFRVAVGLVALRNSRLGNNVAKSAKREEIHPRPSTTTGEGEGEGEGELRDGGVVSSPAYY